MEQVTEMASISLKAGLKPEDSSTSEGKVFGEAIKTVSSQPGFQRCYYGRQIEDAAKIRWFIDWDSKASHETFMATDGYKPFLQNLGPLMDAAPTIFHAELSPFPATAACGAPATEVVEIHLPATVTADEQAAVKKNFEKMATAFKGLDGMLGVSSGWVVEEVSDDKADGGKAKCFVLLVGWTSVQAHEDAKSTQLFKDTVAGLQEDGKKVGIKQIGREVFHVNFTQN